MLQACPSLLDEEGDDCQCQCPWWHGRSADAACEITVWRDSSPICLQWWPKCSGLAFGKITSTSFTSVLQAGKFHTQLLPVLTQRVVPAASLNSCSVLGFVCSVFLPCLFPLPSSSELCIKLQVVGLLSMCEVSSLSRLAAWVAQDLTDATIQQSSEMASLKEVAKTEIYLKTNKANLSL